MPIFTPHGLKIRFDEEALEKVMGPLNMTIDFNDLLLDIELWELLPVAMGEVAAIITAFLTSNWLFTLIAGIIGLLIGGVIREVTYSDFMRRLFPLFLGSGPVTIVATIVCGIYLGFRGEYLTIVVLVAFLFLSKIEAVITGIVLAPLIYFMVRKYLKRIGMPLTHVERVFITLCNNRAKTLGIELDWGLYAKGNR
jgi:tetrahydromethanopterin S-methyltransferase subunit C